MSHDELDPPQNLFAEQCVLGSMMVSPDRAIPDVIDNLRGSDYYRPAHETIHDTIVALYDRREPVDMTTVAGDLQRRGELDKLGGALYIHDLAQAPPVTANAAYYAREVAEAATRRRLINAGTQVRQIARDVGDINQAAQDAQQAVAEAAEQVNTVESGVLVGASIADTIDWLERDTSGGAKTPWTDVNWRTNGLLPGQMITVAARPGHGKSLVAKDVALYTAQQGIPVHVATLEMTLNEYNTRILAGLGKVDLGKMLSPELTLSDEEWERIAKASTQLQDVPLNIDDRKNQSMAQIRAAARRVVRRYGSLGLIVIDYAQLVRPAKERNIREQEVAQISRDTKLLGGEFGCPVMLLAQLNRGNVNRTDHTPIVSDLRESGALEQDSDQVWLLHRPDQYAGGEERTGEVDLIVGKNRNAFAPATVSLAFQGHYGRIDNLYRTSPRAAS